MSNLSQNKRIDIASRVIQASSQTIYQAFLHPESLATWLPPTGMSGQVNRFEPAEGGSFQITLTYEDGTASGKTSDNTDVVQGRFVELVPDKRIVQAVLFDSENPAFAGEMVQSWVMEPVEKGTKVTIICENVPAGIRKEDHDIGLRSTLENLAAFVE
ncbi:SRPBCC family protein [Gracilibacillus alcaliphilus]|uniref:SRPBCC family protein n=1 Tax=Gracilibacillus alcaliphilus TaxID=1401441 RepID=UPI00195AC8FD|nr:SRPBCC family protein [Gracilibacillus alcaliphilus]MBM7675643.1 uncharacterized protein YndB with AHSA1/START domain [Gracilibacillus alcaliphilus]